MFQRLSLLLLPLLFLAACQAPTTPATSPSLTGYWKSSFGDGFEVSGTTFTQYDDAVKVVSWAGAIQGSPDLTATSGSLTLKITDQGSWKKTVGRYYVIKWKGLGSAGVKQSSASNFPNPTPEPSTQADAEVAFTAANGSFAFFGDYARQ